MERRVLFSLQESRKVAALPPPSSGTSDLVSMKQLAKRLFSVLQSNDDFSIQNFDATFEEWVEVDHSFVAEDKQKFRIVDISVKQAEKLPKVVAATAVQSAEVGDGDSNATHARCSVQDKVKCNQEKCTPTRVVAVQQPSLPRRSMLEERLPMPFVIPKNFPPLVAAGLQAKSLTSKATAKFISEIARAVFRFKSYPTRDEKEHVARQCVSAYPFLEASSGTGHDYIVMGLEERLKYLRRPYKRGQKRPLGNADEQVPPAKRCPKPVMPGTVAVTRLVEQSIGEGAARNVKVMQSVSQQTHPDPSSVRDPLERTFHSRSMPHNPCKIFTIHSFLEMYPFLAKSNPIQSEFDRIVADLNTNFLAMKLRWLEVGPKVIALAEAEQGNGHICALLQQSMDDSDEGTQSLLALSLLSCMLPDSHSKVDHTRVLKIVPANADLAQEAALLPTKQCCLLATGTAGRVQDVYLILDNQVLTRVKKTEAVATLFSSFFVFSINYAVGTVSLFQFLEFIFLKKKVPKKPRLTRVIATLKL